MTTDPPWTDYQLRQWSALSSALAHAQARGDERSEARLEDTLERLAIQWESEEA